MNNKKHVIIALIVGLLVGTTITVSAGTWVQAYKNDEIKIVLNGKIQTFNDETTKGVEYPLTYNNRTYLPLRSLATLLGFEVKYDEKTKTAIIETPDYVDEEKNGVVEENTTNDSEEKVPTKEEKKEESVPVREEEEKEENTQIKGGEKKEEATQNKEDEATSSKDEEKQPTVKYEEVEMPDIDIDLKNPTEVPTIEFPGVGKKPGIERPVQPKPTPVIK